MKKTVIILSLAFLLFSSCRVPSDFTSVVAVHLDRNTVEMRVGEKQILKANIVPQKAAERDLYWTSSNDSIAIVNNGIITAISPGRVTVSVSLESGETTACSVTVMPGLNSEIVNIQIAAMPDKLRYFLGEEFDITGLSVTALYTDNLTVPIHITEENITGFNSADVGEKTLTVTYGSVSAVFSILVVQVLDIEITSEPVKKLYNRDEPLDITGLTVGISYFDGSGLIEGSVSNIEQYITGFNSSTAGTITVTITYGGYTVEFTVIIAGIGKIEVKELPLKKEYRIGEVFSLDGLVIEATYTEGGSDIIPNRNLTVTGFDSYSPGDKTITISYGGVTTSFVINIIGVRSISIKKLPDKLVFKQGDTLDISGMEVEATLTNDDVEPVIIILSNISGFNPNIAGFVTLTINYAGTTAEYEVTIAEMTAIEVTRNPYKINYKIGDLLDITGIIVTATYSYEDIHITDHLAVSAANISGFDSYSCGVKELNVIYRGIQTVFYITVLDIVSIVVSNPNKSIYKIGETLDITGLTASALYTDGETGHFSIPLSNVSAFDSSTAGNKTLTVTISGVSGIFTVTVVTVSQMQIIRLPYKLEYTVGEALSIAGMEVEATYSGGSVTFKETLTITSSNITGFDSSTVGTKTLSIINTVNSVSFTIRVIRSVEKIIIITNPNKTQYILGDALDITGIVVKAVFDDGSEELVSVINEDVGGFNSNLVGIQVLSVTYLGKTDYYSVNVGQAEVFSITFANTDQMPQITGKIVIYLVNGNRTAQLSVTNPQDYSSINWYVLSTGVRASGPSFILDAANPGYNRAGKYFISVEVIKDTKPYGGTIEFEVRN